MSAIPAIVPVSELRRDASGLIKSVVVTHEPLIITQRGHAKAVLQDIDTYRTMQRKLAIAELLARGEQELQEGKGIAASEVQTKAQTLLSQLGTANAS